VAGVRRFEDLVVWQLSVELRDGVLAAVSNGRARHDRKFCEQIQDSARSAPRNIAEGFDRFRPRQFIQLLLVAKASLAETRNHLYDGQTSGYFTPEEATRLRRLSIRASIATTRLINYLESCDGRPPHAGKS
jgi:four helix bundle protein